MSFNAEELKRLALATTQSQEDYQSHRSTFGIHLGLPTKVTQQTTNIPNSGPSTTTGTITQSSGTPPQGDKTSFTPPSGTSLSSSPPATASSLGGGW